MKVRSNDPKMTLGKKKLDNLLFVIPGE